MTRDPLKGNREDIMELARQVGEGVAKAGRLADHILQDGQHCWNCRFCRSNGWPRQCRRWAPDPFRANRGAPWPSVEDNDWCGEWELKAIEGPKG